MSHVAFTQYIDVAQVVLWAFWIFFAGLIFYLRQEDKREGYPMESEWTERTPRHVAIGFPPLPDPKTFELVDGSKVTVPNYQRETREIRAKPLESWPGAPLVPTGNPMVDGVGPASYAERRNVPDLTWEGQPRIVPLRAAPDYAIDHYDRDPRGLTVIGCDEVVAGEVCEVWIDRTESFIRYFEVNTGSRTVMLPIGFVQFDTIRGKSYVRVGSIRGDQFAQVPRTASSNQITRLEEDKIVGYYAGGLLYATKDRQEPIL